MAENNPTLSLTASRDILRQTSAYRGIRLFLIIITILIVVFILMKMFYSLFVDTPADDHSTLGIIGFVWVLVPGVLVGAKYLYNFMQIGVDVADCALLRSKPQIELLAVELNTRKTDTPADETAEQETP